MKKPIFTNPRDALHWRVSGAVARGEAEPVIEWPIPTLTSEQEQAREAALDEAEMRAANELYDG